MTVQRAVTGSPLVAEATAKRVKATAKKLGYRPDPALSALAAYRWKQGNRPSGNVVAFLDCDGTVFSKEVLAGARNEARLLGYEVHVFALPASASGQTKLGRMLYHRGVRGLLFGPSNERERFEGWAWEHFAPVSLAAVSHSPAMDAVAMDYFQGATLAVEYLTSLGCRRIGLAVSAELQVRTGNRWLGGCLAADPEIAVFSGGIHSVPAIRQWQRNHDLDGIATIHGQVYKALRATGAQFVFLNAADCPDGIPHLTLDPARIGSEGIRLLHHALLRGELGIPEEPKMVSLRGSWATA